MQGPSNAKLTTMYPLTHFNVGPFPNSQSWLFFFPELSWRSSHASLVHMDCLYRIGIQPIFINRVWIPATQKMKARCDTQDDATIKNHRWTLLSRTGRTYILYTHAVYFARCILPGCRQCGHYNLGRECLQWPRGWWRPLRWSLLRLQWPSLISRMLVSLLSTRPVERNLLGNVNRWTLGVVSIVWHYTKIQNAQVDSNKVLLQ